MTISQVTSSFVTSSSLHGFAVATLEPFSYSMPAFTLRTWVMRFFLAGLCLPMRPLFPLSDTITGVTFPLLTFPTPFYGSPMSSETLKRAQTNFHSLLKQVLSKYEITPDELKRAGLSQQHLSDLKTGRYRPSADVLRTVLSLLAREQATLRELTQILLMGTALDAFEDDPGWMTAIEFLPLPFDRTELEWRPNLKTRCVVTDKLGEVVYPELFDLTLRQMKDCGTNYFYFLPRSPDFPDANPERDKMLAGLASRSSHERELINDHAYFIKCSSALFLARFRIDNIGLPDQEAMYSLGPPHKHKPVLLEVNGDALERLINIVEPIRIAALRARERGLHKGPLGRSDLTFDLDCFQPEEV